MTLEFMKTTVARQLWTRTLAGQFLYPVQNCCVWMLSASKCPNVTACSDFRLRSKPSRSWSPAGVRWVLRINFPGDCGASVSSSSLCQLVQ